MFIYHRHIFVLYVIHQNNPVSKSLSCIIPWFLRNRSYRRRAPSYRRHPIKLPSSVIWTNLPTVVLRWILRGLLYKNEKRYESVVLVHHAPPPPVFLCCKYERDRWSQRSASRQNLLEANGRVGAILTTVASRGCPQWIDSCYDVNSFHIKHVINIPVSESFGCKCDDL